MMKSNRIGFNLISPGVVIQTVIDSSGENLKVDSKSGS